MYGFINPQLPARKDQPNPWTNPSYSLEFAAIVPDDHLIEMCELTRVIHADNIDRIIKSIKVVYEGADRLKWIETGTCEWLLEVEMDGCPSYVGATLKC